MYTGGALAGLILTQISAGDDFTCALSSAGLAYCWGVGASGQLGNNSATQSNVPVAVYTGGVLAGLTLTQITAGFDTACALASTGAAYCWGLGTNGQLGNGLGTSSTVPVLVSGGLTLTQIDTGVIFTCALTSSGLAYCWGDDASGELGNSSTTQSNVPVAVTTAGTPLSGLTLTQVSAGDATACALSSAGAAYCWGQGTYGQLGNGSTTTAQTTAVAVTTAGTPISGVTLTQLNAGNFFTCALGSAGAAYCWGIGNNGDLGYNSGASSSVPVAVTTTGTPLAGVTLTQISPALGGKFACAVDTFGAAYCWGDNSSGQVGNPDTSAGFYVAATVVPSQATTLAAGYKHTCVIYYGSGHCWGDNTYGELGNNTTVGSTSPATVAAGAMPAGTVLVQVTMGNGFSCALAATGAAYCWGLGTSGQLGNGSSVESNVPVLVSGGLTFTGISAGGSSACGVTVAGAVYCWGLGTSGQLGNNLGTTSSSPVAVYTAGVLSGLALTQVSVGGSAACALATTGAAFCWGLGTGGQLGNGGTTTSNQPVAVSAGGAGVGAVAYSAIGAGGAFACGLSGPGAEYCWGDDTYGELGNNTTTTTPQSTPVAVTTSGALSGVTLAQITAGYDQACALSTTGIAYCWGLGTSGQLGNNTVVSSSVPAAVYTGGVLSGRTLVQITAGQYHTCALDNLGTGYCWGLNSSGQDGRADTGTNFDTPVTIQPSAPDLITAGYTHSCTIRSGKAYCWGANTYGQLGNNSTVSSTVPIAVSTSGVLSGVTLVQINAGNGYTCALSSNGAAYCWGYNADGELGNNSTVNSLVPVAVSTSGVLSGVTLTQITVGQYSACGLSSAGGAYCWGLGTSGQLGNGGTTSSSVPVAVSMGGIPVTAVDAGGLFACAVSTAATAYCWGANANGQLGNSTTTPSNVPVLVNLPGAYVLTITVGFNHACLAAGTTSFVNYCWGDDTYGELGNGATTSTPQSTPVTLAAASALTAAAVPGTVYAANYDTGGQGVAYNAASVNGTANSYRSDGIDLETTSDTQNITAPGGPYDLGWTNSGQWFNYTVYVATAGTYTVALRVASTQASTDALHIANASGTNLTGSIAIPNSGGFQAWTTVNASVTLPAGTQTLTVDQDANNWNLHFMTFTLGSAGAASGGGGTGVPYNVRSIVQVTAGYQSTCALDSSGLAYCWGENNDGQVGNNTTTTANAAATVTGTGVLAGTVLTEITPGQHDTCALDSTGAAYCWGTNSSGQVGNPATAVNFLVPVAVSASEAVTIAAGNIHSCEISSGKAFCWGDNSNGEIGNNTTMPSRVPVAAWTGGALSGVTLTEITTGTNFSCALSAAGAAYCWGLGTSGQLGNNTTTSSGVPVAVYTGGALAGVTLTQISANGATVCALSAAGAAYCWGAGGSGQLGNGTTTAAQSTAVAVTTSGVLSGTVLTEIISGGTSTCALSAGGAAYCWGAGGSGQLGNGTTTAAQSTAVAVTASGVLSGLALIGITVGSSFACALSAAGCGLLLGGGGQRAAGERHDHRGAEHGGGGDHLRGAVGTGPDPARRRLQLHLRAVHRGPRLLLGRRCQRAAGERHDYRRAEHGGGGDGDGRALGADPDAGHPRHYVRVRAEQHRRRLLLGRRQQRPARQPRHGRQLPGAGGGDVPGDHDRVRVQPLVPAAQRQGLLLGR